MSLINDALRKARQAAAEHEERETDTAFRTPVAYPSRGPRKRSGAFGLVLLSIAAAGAGAVGAWWILGRNPTPDNPVQEIAVAEPSTTQVAPGVAGPEDQGLRDSSAMPEEGLSSRADSEVEASPPNPAVAVDGGGDNPGGSPAGDVPEPEAAQPQTPAERPAPRVNEAGQRVFVLDADLGYAKLSLGYIVVRSTNPFAEINGRDVYVGSEVEGFVVETIETDRVILRDGRGELVLRVP